MKRIVIAALIALLLTLPALGANAKDQVIKGSFEAKATPMPAGWPVPGDGCMAGPEGVHRVSKRLNAPFSGWLYANAEFTGDWELAVFESGGSRLAISEHQFNTDEPMEQVYLHVRRGQVLDLAVCNAASTSSAQVTYFLAPGPAWSVPVGKTLVTHTEKETYKSPAVSVDGGGVCHAGYEIGCTGTWDIAPTDRWVYLKVDDALTAQSQRPGQVVSAEVYQYDENTYLGGERFCTSLDEGVRLKPGVDFVGVTILQGTCENGDPAVGTQGEVTFIFSNHKA